MADVRTSLVRTVVPILVGWIIAGAVKAGVHLDPAAVQALVTAAYYLVVRCAERRWPTVGWLLGSPSQPTY